MMKKLLCYVICILLWIVTGCSGRMEREEIPALVPERSTEAEAVQKVPEEVEDIFLMDMGFFQLWETGDYNTETGEPCENKRRLRYPEYVESVCKDYSIELSTDYVLTIYEFDSKMQFVTARDVVNREVFIPTEKTAFLTFSLHRTFSEKSLSLGQWNKLFSEGIDVSISHGDKEKLLEAQSGLLCTTKSEYVAAEQLAMLLLADEGDKFADALWHNQIMNEAYSLTGEELTNGNLTLYFSSSCGDDGNSGLSPLYPKRNFEEFSGISNVNILLKCGDVFRVSDGFEAGSNSVYAAYGEGDRPIMSFYRCPEMLFEKTDNCENVWEADISMLDICNHQGNKSDCNIGQLLMNGEVNWKRKVWSTKDTFNPAGLEEAADNSWAADWNTSKLYLYSEVDPNTLRIEYAPPLHGVSMNKVRNVVFKGIEITGAGCHGISMKDVKNIKISNCYIHHVGGSILTSAGIRYGNAIQLWDGGSDVLVSGNVADWIFDTCYTNQGTDSESVESNVEFTKNVGAHAFWGIETWGDGYSAYDFSDIKYTHNLLYEMMDITNPVMPMYTNKNGKIIFADPEVEKEDYVSYRGGYTYHQMSSVNVNNAGTGEPTIVSHNIFWNTNRFLAIIANTRNEERFSCLSNNLFFGETDVKGAALFRYNGSDKKKTYLENPKEYIEETNMVSVHAISDKYDNGKELGMLKELIGRIAGEDL